MLASGIYGVFDPAGNLDKYGMKGNEKDNAMMRLTAWSQILYAAALNLDTESVRARVRRYAIAAAATRHLEAAPLTFVCIRRPSHNVQAPARPRVGPGA